MELILDVFSDQCRHISKQLALESEC